MLFDDGQIIVLGGLIEDTVNDTVEKVPGLGDIPVIGSLFKYQTRGRTKTNLMVFLRPTVIRSNEQSVNVAGDRYDFIRNLQLNTQQQKSLVLPTIPAPVLPELKNGTPVGGQMMQIEPGLNRTSAPKSTTPPPVATPPATPQ